MEFRHVPTRYEIDARNPKGVNRGVISTEFDGSALSDGATRIPLRDDGETHRVCVMLG